MVVHRDHTGCAQANFGATGWRGWFGWRWPGWEVEYVWPHGHNSQKVKNMERYQWLKLNRSARSAAIATALKQIDFNANVLSFTGISTLFGLWQCSLICKDSMNGYTWTAGLGLRILGMPTTDDKLYATQDDALSAAIPILRNALNDIRDDMIDIWAEQHRIKVLSSALASQIAEQRQEPRQ